MLILTFTISWIKWVGNFQIAEMYRAGFWLDWVVELGRAENPFDHWKLAFAERSKEVEPILTIEILSFKSPAKVYFRQSNKFLACSNRITLVQTQRKGQSHNVCHIFVPLWETTLNRNYCQAIKNIKSFFWTCNWYELTDTAWVVQQFLSKTRIKQVCQG